MRVDVQAVAPEQVEADVLAVPVADGAGLSGAAAKLDDGLGGLLARLASDGELLDDLGKASIVHVDGKLGARRVAGAGVGARDGLNADSLRTAAAAVAHETKAYAERIAWVIDDSLPLPPEEQARAIVDGTLLGGYEPARWKGEGPASKLSTLVICSEADGVKEAAERAATIAAWANRARDLVNSPPNELTPERLAERAQELASGASNLTAEALGPDEIGELGMGALAAVAQGSDNPARLVVLRYDPPDAKGDVFLGLVGKAITFDTGGISLKPSLHMEDMKGDMAGGAAPMEATGAIAELGIPLRVITVAAASENMPSGGAYRPGDIICDANGKTIGITNTDAEGRLVLADALWYARREGATHVLDFATLTGAMEVALGDLYAGLFANDDTWRDDILGAAQTSGDHTWPFPLHPRYRRYVDSAYADMKNSSELRQAGAVLAAEFLREFSGDGPWAHIDMAGPGFLERSRGAYYTQRGGTGYGVRLIAELAQRFSA